MSEVSTAPIFDPAVHLNYEEPAKRYTMAELGLDGQKYTSEIAVTDPFQFISAEGIRAIREELLKPDVVGEFSVNSKLSDFQVRGASAAKAPFLHALWRHPATLKAVSTAAGIDLIPIMDIEFTHTNIQVNKGSTREETLAQLKPEPTPAHPTHVRRNSADSGYDSDEANTKDEQPQVVGWHRDSYPWVCVIMLSDVSNSKGGETAIKQGDGSIVKVRGPQLGTAVMMQGKYIEHCALPCEGSAERLTLVCSFRARDANIVDDSHLLTVRMCSNWNDLYYQWTTYRLRLLADRFNAYADALDKKASEQESVQAGGAPALPVVDLEDFRVWVREQTRYLDKTRDEMHDYSLAPAFDKLCTMGGM